MKFILSKEKGNSIKMIDYLLSNNYFEYAAWLWDAKLLNKYAPKIIEDSVFKIPTTAVNGKNYPKYVILQNGDNYKMASEFYLKDSPAYRNFMFNYLRFLTPVNRYQKMVKNTSTSNPNITDYYVAKAYLQSQLLEDWFMSSCIIFGFDYYSFNNIEELYNFYLPQTKTPYFKNALEKKYAIAKNIKPGVAAPNFSLPNDKGKTISLSDFKGKVVYIDFWGVGCGPCIYDMDNYGEKLHKEYKEKDIVFINICVDSGEKVWKSAIKEHKLTGINLMAEGWAKNPVCKTYGISGIPHYIIINKDGTIANNNAPRMGHLLNNGGQNELDVALKKN